MTHPITPPPELVARFWREASAGREDAPIGEIFNHGVYLAYQAGADQELEACCELLTDEWGNGHGDRLRRLRRPSPKPPSLKEQALAALQEAAHMADDIPPQGICSDQIDTIRRALEQLPN